MPRYTVSWIGRESPFGEGNALGRGILRIFPIDKILRHVNNPYVPSIYLLYQVLRDMSHFSAHLF